MSALVTQRRGPSPRRRTNRRPRLELLEDRLAPAVLTVNSLADGLSDGTHLTLREAVALVDSGGPVPGTIDPSLVDTTSGGLGTGDAIRFSVTGTIPLNPALGSLTLTKDVTVSGPGASNLALRANGLSFGASMVQVQGATVTLSGLTLSGAQLHAPTGTVAYGAALASTGTLTVNNCTLSGNFVSGGSGGAVFNDGTMALNGCTLSNNWASSGGAVESGAVVIVSPGGTGPAPSASLTVTNSTLSQNTSTAGGGGIDSHGTLTVTDSTLSRNSALTGGGIATDTGTATVTGCTLSANTAQDGGGISNRGTLTVTSTTLSGNSASTGGGIENLGTRQPFGTISPATLTVTRSAFSGNTARADGGGIASTLGTLTLSNSTLSGNSATSRGGGLATQTGTATVTRSAFSGNTAQEGGGAFNMDVLKVTMSTFTANSAYSGGGIANTQGTALSTIDPENPGALTVDGSTFLGNTARGNGGGISVASGTLTLTGSTFSGDSATGSGGGIASISGTVTATRSTFTGDTAGVRGGGLLHGGALTLTNCTVVGNTAQGRGGGIDGLGQTVVCNSIVARNAVMFTTASPTPGAPPVTVTYASNIEGTLVNAAKSLNNLIGVLNTSSASSPVGGAGGLVDGVGGNRVGVADSELLLGPLGDYTGPTQTIPLLPGSPALDAGNPAFAGSFDQRGLSITGAPDIGAFESQGFDVEAQAPRQFTAVNHPFAAPLVVLVTAKNPREPVAGGVVTFTSVPSPGGASATLSARTAVIGPDGKASVLATANGVAGEYAVNNTAAGGTMKHVSLLTNTSSVPEGALRNSGPALTGRPVTVRFFIPPGVSTDVRASLHFTIALSPGGLATSYAGAGVVDHAALRFSQPGDYTVYGRMFASDGSFEEYTTVVTVVRRGGGNVRAYLIGGTLYVKGDAQANSVGLDQPAAGQVRIRPGLLSQTRIDGQSRPLTFLGVRNVRVVLAGGDDTLVVDTMARPFRLPGALTYDGGSGSNRFQVRPGTGAGLGRRVSITGVGDGPTGLTALRFGSPAPRRSL